MIPEGFLDKPINEILIESDRREGVIADRYSRIGLNRSEDQKLFEDERTRVLNPYSLDENPRTLRSVLGNILQLQIPLACDGFPYNDTHLCSSAIRVGLMIQLLEITVFDRKKSNSGEIFLSSFTEQDEFNQFANAFAHAYDYVNSEGHTTTPFCGEVELQAVHDTIQDINLGDTLYESAQDFLRIANHVSRHSTVLYTEEIDC